MIIGIGSTLFSEFTAGFGGNSPTIDQAMAIVLAALSLLGLGIFGPGIANGLVSGGPQLGAGSTVGTGLAAGGVIAVAAAGVGGVATAGSALASGTAAAARGGASLAGGAAKSYSLGAAGQSGLKGVGGGLGGMVRAAGSAVSSPLKRASASMQSSFSAGGRAAEATGGMGPTASGGGGTTSSDPAPAWAKRMKRGQAMSHGVSTAAHAIRSGDAHGGGSSVNLSERDR